jgi:sulfoxide reductase heme-binding subunit YedZ
MTVAVHIVPAWFTSRAAGIVALLLCSLSVTLGLLKVTGSVKSRIAGMSIRSLHEALALAALAMIAVHGLALLLDPFLKPGVAGVLVPFANPYRTVATGVGQLAAYGLVALSLSFYFRRAIGAAAWRKAHALIPAFWALGVIHGLTAGTDRFTWWFLATLVLPAFPALVLLAIRIDTAWLAPQAAMAQSAASAGAAEGEGQWAQGELRAAEAGSRPPSRQPLW